VTGSAPPGGDPLSIAYHEAGHAVIALDQRIAVRRVEVTPDSESEGRLSLYPNVAWLQELGKNYERIRCRVRHRLEAEIMISWAGTLAEQKYRGTADKAEVGFGESREQHEGFTRFIRGGDADQIAEFVLRLFEERDLQEAYSEWLYLRTRKKVYHDVIWLQIDADARALSERKRLSRKEVKDISNAAVWAAIEAQKTRLNSLAETPPPQ
jgi:hypothetical protein